MWYINSSFCSHQRPPKPDVDAQTKTGGRTAEMDTRPGGRPAETANSCRGNMYLYTWCTA